MSDIRATINAGCGHEIEIEIKRETLCLVCVHVEDYQDLCESCFKEIDEIAEDDECGSCYHRNHPSLTAYERNL